MDIQNPDLCFWVLKLVQSHGQWALVNIAFTTTYVEYDVNTAKSLYIPRYPRYNHKPIFDYRLTMLPTRIRANVGPSGSAGKFMNNQPNKNVVCVYNSCSADAMAEDS
jgi:hypothetical protein